MRHKASWYASWRVRVTLPWRVITIAFRVFKGVEPQGGVGAEALMVGGALWAGCLGWKKALRGNALR